MLTASIIIPNLNSPHLVEIIQALRQQTIKPLEVLIIGHDCYHSVQDDDWVRLLPTSEPIPPACARNLGLSYARGEICCFLDADCVPTQDWLEHLLKHHQQGQTIVGGSIAIGDETFWQRCDNIASMGSLLSTAPPGLRPYLATANFSIRQNVLRKIGGFDPGFRFASGEDTDLSFRLRKGNYMLYFAPEAVVIHRTNRKRPGAIWKHLWLYGYQWPRIQEKHIDLIGLSCWQYIYQKNYISALFLIPFLVSMDTYGIYAQQPSLLWKYWNTCPVVFFARLAWYGGRIAYMRENQV